jgi:hypothetical protein
MGRTHLPSLLFCLLIGTTACVRTDITRQAVSGARGPYRHILVCSFSKNPDRARRLEDLLTKNLRAHHVTAQSCHDTLTPERLSAPQAQTLAWFHDQGIQAILIIQSTQKQFDVESSSGLAQTPATATAGQFLESYAALSREARSAAPLAHVVVGEADLIDVAQDHVVWYSVGGTEGIGTASTESYLKSISGKIESELSNEGVIPPRLRL